jgi:protein gp37
MDNLNNCDRSKLSTVSCLLMGTKARASAMASNGVGGHKLQVGGMRKWCGHVFENGTHPEKWPEKLGNSWNRNWGHAIFRQTHISLCWNQVYQSTPKKKGQQKRW